MTRWPALVWLVLTFIAGSTSPAVACSCAGPSRPCEAFWKTNLVFIGVVRSVTIEKVTHERYTYDLSAFTFDVIETPRGEASESIVIRSRGSSCDWVFEVGESYVVYAWREGGEVTTSGCSRTARLSNALEDLAYIRELPPTPPKDDRGRLTGTVRRHGSPESPAPQTDEDFIEAPMRRAIGYPVSLTLTSESFSMVVDSRDARFDAPVPPGGYLVEARAPVGFYAEAYPDFLVLPDARGCAEVNVSLLPDGHVTGQVLDAEGEPAAGVEVGVVRAGTFDEYLPEDRATTGEDGRFEIPHIRPGKYVVRPTIPGSVASASAIGRHAPRTVEVRESAHEDVGQIRLPAGLALRTVRGSVVDAHGAPVPGVTTFPSPVTDGEGYEHFGSSRTDDEGRFVIAIPVDRQFVIRADRERYRLDQRGRWEVILERAEAPIPDSNEVQLTLKRAP